MVVCAGLYAHAPLVFGVRGTSGGGGGGGDTQAVDFEVGRVVSKSPVKIEEMVHRST